MKRKLFFGGLIFIFVGMYLKRNITMFHKIINLGINCLICLMAYAGVLIVLFRKTFDEKNNDL